MSDTETAVVGLQLDKSYEAEAAKAATATEALDKALGKVGSTKGGIDAAEAAMKKLRKSSDDAAKAMQKAMGSGFGGRTPTALQGSPKAAGGFQQIVGAVGKMFGDRAAGGLVRGAAALAQVEDKLAPFGLSLEGVLGGGASMLMGAGGAVLAGGEVVLKAAAALMAASVGVAAAGYKFGVEKTAQRNAANSALEKLGMNGGYEVAINLAAKYNLDEGEAVTQIKKLLNAGFKKEQIPALIRVKAGMDAAGLDGDALLGKLEKIQLSPKVKTTDIDKLAVKGIDTNEVWSRLAKTLGTDVAGAQAKVKAGSVDAAAAVKAITDTAGGKFGPLADELGNSVGGKVHALQLAFGELFSHMNLDPLKGFLDMLLNALKSPAGEKLAQSLGQVFSAISNIFAGIKPEDVVVDILVLAKGFSKLAAGINEAAPTIRFVGGILLDIGIGALLVAGDILEFANSVVKGFKKAAAEVEEFFDKIGKLLGITTDTTSIANAGGGDIGSALANGLTDGIAGGQSGAIQAAVAMVENAINAAHVAADAHSPSRIMANLGNVGLGGGLVVGMGQAANDVGNAGAALSGAAIGGASGGLGQVPTAGGGAGAGGGAKGGGSYTININVAGAGGGADIAAAVRREVTLIMRDHGAESGEASS